jgi:hypothetical protein
MWVRSRQVESTGPGWARRGLIAPPSAACAAAAHISQHNMGVVVPGRALHLAAKVRPGAAQIEAFDLCPVVKPSELN